MADNDRLLERLICIQPKTRDQDWNIMDDAYGCKLWDVHPSCQISGIGHGTKYQGYKHDAAKGIDQLRHTVIIDGLHGAQVRWKSFERVALRHGNSLVRSVITRLIAWSAYTFWIGLALVIISTKWAMAMVSSESYYGDDYYPTESYFDINGIVTALLMMALAIILFLMGVASIVFRPEFLITRWGGKKWGNQPWLFGVEGHCDIGEIESKLFGVNHGHLKWDAFGSPLSRHAPNEFGEVEGVDPMERADVRAYVQQVRARGDTRVGFYPFRRRVLTDLDIHARRHEYHDGDAVRGGAPADCVPAGGQRGRDAAGHRGVDGLDDQYAVPRMRSANGHAGTRVDAAGVEGEVGPAAGGLMLN
jgi:hypothetical protein